MALTPSPQWLDTGNNAWQMAAATFVGLQSIPGLTVLYGGIVKKKWAINSAFMSMYAFASVLVVWVLFDYNMAFGEQWFPFLGMPGPATSATYTIGQANNVLVFPGLSAPPLLGSILMLGAGLAWGIYSLRGQGERNPASVTAGNFVRAVPLAAALSIIFLPWTNYNLAGITYAITSGAVTSGLGYVIWYSALPGLKTASAANAPNRPHAFRNAT